MTYVVTNTANNTFAKDTTRGSKTSVSFVKARSTAKKFDTEAAATDYIRANGLSGVAIINVTAKVSPTRTPGVTPQRRATDGGETIRIWGWFDDPQAGIEHQGVKTPPRVTVTSDTNLTFTEAWAKVGPMVHCNDPFPFSHIALTGKDAAAFRADSAGKFPIQAL